MCEDYGHNLEDIRTYLTDKVPLTTEWFKEEWLAFEDKAPNPYTAETLKVSVLKIELIDLKNLTTVSQEITESREIVRTTIESRTIERTEIVKIVITLRKTVQ